jgi:hypothetical protein
VSPSKKKPGSKGKQKAATQARQNFSRTQVAGSSAQSCPLKKQKPCNLILLKLTEPEAEMGEEEGTRVGEIRKGQKRNRGANPVQLAPGGLFQMTAPSAANEPRELVVDVTTQAVCGGAIHPELAVSDSEGVRSVIGKQATLGFTRAGLDTDSGLPGLWVILSSAWNQSPVSYPVSATTCGVPASGPPVDSLSAVIDVYPADKFELELELPPLFEPESMQYERNFGGWMTAEDRKKEAMEAEAAENRLTNTTPTKATPEEEEEEDDESLAEKITVSLTQQDGTRSLEAPIDDIVKLVRMIHSAERAVKEIQDWVDGMQVGPGYSVKVECQFLVGHVKAEWGYTEFSDDRVFFAYSGSLQLDLMKLSAEFNIGWKCAGLADAYLKVGGEGAISISAEAAVKTPTQKGPSGNIEPEGEIELSGGVEGAFGWVITASATLNVTFKAELEDFKFLTRMRIFGGKVTFSREPTNAEFTIACILWGSRTREVEVFKGNEDLGSIELS